MVSFLKKEDDNKTSLSDIIVLIIIIALVAGGYFYFDNAKKKSKAQFTQAHELYDAKDYKGALTAYEDLVNAPWSNDSLDSIAYEIKTQLLDIQEDEVGYFADLSQAIAASDTVKIQTLLAEERTFYFLTKKKKAEIAAWKSQYPK